MPVDRKQVSWSSDPQLCWKHEIRSALEMDGCARAPASNQLLMPFVTPLSGTRPWLAKSPESWLGSVPLIESHNKAILSFAATCVDITPYSSSHSCARLWNKPNGWWTKGYDGMTTLTSVMIHMRVLIFFFSLWIEAGYTLFTQVSDSPSSSF